MKQNRLIISKYLHYAWLRFHVLQEKKEEEEEDKKKTEISWTFVTLPKIF